MAISTRAGAPAKGAAKGAGQALRPNPAAGRRRPSGAQQAMPAAGPHAQPHLTDAAKTPGAGTLPDPARPQDDTATSG